MVYSLTYVGTISATLTVGFIMKYGRRKTLIVFNLITFVIGLLMLVQNYYIMMATRVLYGYTSGIICITVVRYL